MNRLAQIGIFIHDPEKQNPNYLDIKNFKNGSESKAELITNINPHSEEDLEKEDLIETTNI